MNDSSYPTGIRSSTFFPVGACASSIRAPAPSRAHLLKAAASSLVRGATSRGRRRRHLLDEHGGVVRRDVAVRAFADAGRRQLVRGVPLGKVAGRFRETHGG